MTAQIPYSNRVPSSIPTTGQWFCLWVMYTNLAVQTVNGLYNHRCSVSLMQFALQINVLV